VLFKAIADARGELTPGKRAAFEILSYHFSQYSSLSMARGRGETLQEPELPYNGSPVLRHEDVFWLGRLVPS
jgi:hypothetical protein